MRIDMNTIVLQLRDSFARLVLAAVDLQLSPDCCDPVAGRYMLNTGRSARQILLRYGDACEVLEPAELVALFRKTARGLAEIYGAD